MSRERVYKFFLHHRDQGKMYTVNHFLAEGISKSTVFRVIKRAENDSGHERVKGSGRIAKKMTPTNIRRLKVMFDQKDGVSLRQAARKFNTVHSHIQKTLKSRTSIRRFKKKKIPKRTEAQKNKAKALCGRLYRLYQEKSIIMDDESYFTLKHSSINGNDGFYSSDVSQAPSGVKFSPKAKFENKLLVYLVASPKGVSKPIFRESGSLAVNQKVYMDCIKKRFVPFINEHHSDGEYVFWPDLASSHYAKTVTTFFDDNDINYVKRSDNPPNVPEVRPIEDFWSILKGIVYEGNWQADTIDQLRRRIEYSLKKIDPAFVQSLFDGTLSRLDNVRRHGLIENSN